jgi:hypothetical protein
MAGDLHFSEERFEKIRDKGNRSAGIEGAIGALFNTKGDMDVEPGSRRGILGWNGLESQGSPRKECQDSRGLGFPDSREQPKGEKTIFFHLNPRILEFYP